MTKSTEMKSDKKTNTVGHVFGTPLVVKGKTWFPLTELVVLGIMTQQAGKRQPGRSWPQCLEIGALTMATILGSEWCHNLAHAAAACLIGKPMDALRITWGMPLVIYHDINDKSVSPRQHIVRALGGPVCNAFILALSMLLRPLTRPDSAGREVADAAVGMNRFLCSVSMLPIPGINGGPVLKWTLVEKGQTPEKADETVRKVNGVLSGGLGIAAAVSFRKRRRFLGGILAMLAVSALGVYTGLFHEKS